MPEVTLTAPGVPARAPSSVLEGPHPGAGREPVAAEHLDDGGDVAVVDRLAPVGQHAQTSVSSRAWKSSRLSHSSLRSELYWKPSGTATPSAGGV